jgi:hypothetical protein
MDLPRDLLKCGNFTRGIESGVKPCLAMRRYSSARSRAWFSVTTSAPPKPKSVRSGAPLMLRCPLTTTRTIQRRAPDGSTTRYNPPPSPCRPAPRFSTSFFVSFPVRAIDHTTIHTTQEKHMRQIERKPEQSRSAVKSNEIKKKGRPRRPVQISKNGVVAEAVGFEPTVEFPLR